MATRRAAFLASNRRMRDDVREEIVDAMARAFHVNAFAQLQDELAERGLKHVSPGPGGDWMDVAPPTPDAAKQFAKKFALAIERDNGASLRELYARAVATPGTRYGKRDAPHDFGHGFAMQSLGHGVSWFDDNPEFPIELPDTAYSYDKYKGKITVMENSISGSRRRGTRGR